MNTLETLQALRQEIFEDCLVFNSSNFPIDSPANDAVLICIEVIDEYIEKENQNQQ